MRVGGEGGMEGRDREGEGREGGAQANPPSLPLHSGPSLPPSLLWGGEGGWEGREGGRGGEGGREGWREGGREGGRGPPEARVPSLPPASSLGPLPPSRSSGSLPPFSPPSLPLILFKTL